MMHRRFGHFKQHKVDLKSSTPRNDPVRLKELEQISGQTNDPDSETRGLFGQGLRFGRIQASLG